MNTDWLSFVVFMVMWSFVVSSITIITMRLPEIIEMHKIAYGTKPVKDPKSGLE